MNEVKPFNVVAYLEHLNDQLKVSYKIYEEHKKIIGLSGYATAYESGRIDTLLQEIDYLREVIKDEQ